MVPMGRIELPTSPLPRECSATELHGHDLEPLQNDYLKGGATKSPVGKPGWMFETVGVRLKSAFDASKPGRILKVLPSYCQGSAGAALKPGTG